MVAQYAEGNSFFAVAEIIFFTGDVFNRGNGAGEYICIIVTLFLLQYAYQALKAHTGIYMLCW
ncbi:hypothetical protein D3C80_1803960 [compost metagenome]